MYAKQWSLFDFWIVFWHLENNITRMEVSWNELHSLHNCKVDLNMSKLLN